ncbi:hypothetical protein F443_00358, partial [Phytophthora nicotianae P1569]
GEHVCVTGDDVIARDVQEEMLQLLELRSLGSLGVLPGRVWRDVKDEMIREYGERSGLRFFPKREAIGVIRRLQSKRQAFWDYFVKTWCDTYGISCWNISGMMKENVEIVNRTNNSLKPNNWKLTDTFGAPHPRILNFVEVLKQEAKNYLNQLADVRHRRERPPLHAAPYRYTCVPRLR